MKTNAKASRRTRPPDVPAAKIDWTKTRMAAAVLAVANIVVFGVEAWKTWVDKLRVAALMRQFGAMAWPYPAYHPDYPFGYVALPDSGFALYDTTPDYLAIWLAICLLVSCCLSATGLARRPGRLRALWPTVLFTLIAGIFVLSHAGTVIELPDLLMARISPSAKTVTSGDTNAMALCQSRITIDESDSRSGSDFSIYLGNAITGDKYVTSFPHHETAAAFAALVSAMARQAGCADAMQVVFKS
jgi:hypothetical protein